VELHRIIPVAPFAADPLWSQTQVAPPDTVLATIPSTSEVIGTRLAAATEGGRIYWYAIPYDGGDPLTSRPIDGTGMTFDARVIYPQSTSYRGSPGVPIVAGRKSPGEVEGALVPIGREIEERNVPRGVSGTLQMIAVAGVPVGVTHLWLFWSWERRTSGG
jgi:hypothetical protein